MDHRSSSELQLQPIALNAPRPAYTTRSSTPSEEHDGYGKQSSSWAETPQRTVTPPNEPESAPAGAHELPPVDTGRGAYMFLVCCFVVETLVWGFPFSFGVFQDYYRTSPDFRDSEGFAVIGTCAMGIMYLGAPVFLSLQRIYPRLFLWAPLTGLLTMCLSLSLSSFSTTVTHLILTQGVIYSIGGGICYFPCIIYTDQWFVRRKGFAYGVMWSGTGLGGVTIPLLLQWLLGQYGFRTTLRVWAVTLFVLTAPLVYFIRPRLPPARKGRINKSSFTTLWDPTFLFYLVTTMIQALGFFLPGVYLPTFARTELGAGPLPAALTVMLINVALVFGCLAMGLLVDRLHPTTCILICSAGAAVGTLLLWGFATNLAMLYIFCIIYGLFAGSYTSTWSGVMRHMSTRMENVAKRRNGDQATQGEGTSHDDGGSAFDPTAVLGFLAAGRGIGNMASGPMSEAMIKGMPWQGEAAGAYGSGYGTLIAFTGATAVLGGASFVFKRIGWM